MKCPLIQHLFVSRSSHRAIAPRPDYSQECSGVSSRFIKEQVVPTLRPEAPGGTEKMQQIIQNDDRSTLQAVVTRGLRTELRYDNGASLLHMAARGGSSSLLNYVLKTILLVVPLGGLSIRMTYKLKAIFQIGKTKGLILAVNSQDTDGNTPLMLSIMARNDIATRLIMRRVDLDIHVTNRRGWDAPLLACM